PPAPGSRRAARPRLALVRRSGLDLVLVGLGVVGYTQLRRYAGTAGAAALTGRVDPFVVAAPALVLLAVSVVSLRLLPVLTRLGRRLASRSRGLPTAWGGWQVDRYLPRQSGLVLLLVLAVAMGSLALVHRGTAAQAHADQATYQVGADLRVDLPMAPAAASLTVEQLLAAEVGGRDRVLPVLRRNVTVGPLDGVDLLALDVDRAPGVVRARPDQLGGRDLAGLLEPLVAARPTAAVLDLPGEPTTLDVDVELADAPSATASEPAAAATPGPATGGRLAVVLEDGSGLWHRVVVDLPTAPGRHTLTFDLTGGSGDGGPTYPLAVVGLDAELPGPLRPDLVREMRTVEAGAAPVVVPGSAEWSWSGGDGRAVAVRAGATAAGPLPVLVTPGVLAAAGAEVGDEVRIPWNGGSLTLVPTAVVPGWPSLDEPREGIVADLPSLVARGLDPADLRTTAAALAAPDRVTQWWLGLPESADGTDASAVAEALREALPPGTVVADRAAAAAELAADPLAAGMSQALLLVTGAALVLAVIGFAVTTVVLMNRQRGELAVLYALGAAPRAVRRALLVERAALVTGTTVLGVVLGTVAAVAIVPSTVLSTDVVPPVPAVQVAPPWLALVGFAVAVVVLLLLVTLGLVRRLRPRRVAAILRAGGTT
ncbi:ABC transporter permease, partial [Georgenia yuyongxinii]